MEQVLEAIYVAYSLSVVITVLGAFVLTCLEWRGSSVRLDRRALLLLPVVAVSAVLCFGWLDSKLPWEDEGHTAVRLSGRGPELLKEIARGTTLDEMRESVQRKGSLLVFLLRPGTHSGDVHPPLYFMMAQVWARFFGGDIVTIRGLSAFLGVVTVLAVAWLGIEAFGCWNSALLAAAFVAVSPFQAVYAQEARMYTLLGLLAVLSSAALLRALRIESRRSWALFASFVGLGVLTHGLFGAVVVGQAAYVVFCGGRQRMAGLLACGAGALVVLPFLARLLLLGLHRRLGWLRTSDFLEGGLGGILTGLGTALTHTGTLRSAAGVLLLLAAVLVVRSSGHGLLLATVVLAGVGLPWLGDLITGAKSVGVTRYLGVPGLIALVALARVAMLAVRRQRLVGAAVVIALLALSSRSAFRAASASAMSWKGSDTREMLRPLEACLRPILLVDTGRAVSLLVILSQSTSHPMQVAMPAAEPPEGDAFLLNVSASSRATLAAQWRLQIVSVAPSLDRVLAGPS